MLELEILFGRRLGKGGFGTVYAHPTKKSVVVKVTRDRIEAETARRLLANPHPRFVKVFAVTRLDQEFSWLIVRERADRDGTWEDVCALRTELQKENIRDRDLRDLNVGRVRRGRKWHVVVRDLGAARFP